MKTKLLIAHVFDPQKYTEFATFPPHITLAPWFEVSEQIVTALLSYLDLFAQRMTSIEAVYGDHTLFGPCHDVSVTTIRPNELLQDLHRELLAIAYHFGATVPQSEYTGESYRPHTTHKEGWCPQGGDKVTIDSFSLVQSVSEVPKKRRILHTFAL